MGGRRRWQELLQQLSEELERQSSRLEQLERGRDVEPDINASGSLGITAGSSSFSQERSPNMSIYNCIWDYMTICGLVFCRFFIAFVISFSSSSLNFPRFGCLFVADSSGEDPSRSKSFSLSVRSNWTAKAPWCQSLIRYFE